MNREGWIYYPGMKDAPRYLFPDREKVILKIPLPVLFLP
jgi:hypothetical protein